MHTESTQRAREFDAAATAAEAGETLRRITVVATILALLLAGAVAAAATGLA